MVEQTEAEQKNNWMIRLLLYSLYWSSDCSPGRAVGLRGEQLADRLVLTPNEGIRRSRVNGCVFLLIVGLVFGLFTGLVAAAQHYVLRIFLWATYGFPLKAIPFLEDATTCMLLRRVGGGYSFYPPTVTRLFR